MASTELVFQDEPTCKASITDLRSNDSPTNWVLFTYSDNAKNTIQFVAKGSGGVDELKSHLHESKMFYGLVRVEDKIDNSVTVKFVFICWCGKSVNFIQKAKMTTHKGSIVQLVGQYHNDINASDLEELSESIIIQKVRDASGTSVHVKEGAAAAPTSPATSTRNVTHVTAKSTNTTKQPGVPQSATIITWIDEEATRTALKRVRADNDETDWVLLGYDPPTGNSTKIKMEGHGQNGLEELISHLKEDQVQYGLYRTTDTIDNTVAVKFVLILWVGEKVQVTRKARITTHKGEVTAFIGQYHVDISASNTTEISEDIVRDLVQRVGGTAIHVKNK